MNDAELVGGVLYDAADPEAAAVALVRLLTSPDTDPRHARDIGLEPALIEALRHALPRNPCDIELACIRGAAWVLGRRSVAHHESWELVASLPPETSLPSGLRRTTAESLISLVSTAEYSIRFAAPYVDQAGLGVVTEAIAVATQRGVEVELFEPAGWKPSTGAIAELHRQVDLMGDPTRLKAKHMKADAPWAHLKVVVADRSMAYIGSANMTGAGLAGRNLELGVLVRGPGVATIDSILNLYMET